MATSCSSSALNKLEEQLTCAICLDIYTNPRILSCLHSFCQKCLESLDRDLKGDKKFIACPTCRSSTELPEPAGVAGFPVAFQLNNLKDVYILMKKATQSDEQKATCDNCTRANATGYCKDCAKFLCQKCIDIHNGWTPIANHEIAGLNEVTTSSFQLPAREIPINCFTHMKALTMYCETCEELVCHDCTRHGHKDHDHGDIDSDFCRKQCQKLEFGLSLVREKMTAVINALAVLTNRENEITEHGEAIKEEIHVMVEELIDILRQSERQLTRDVQTIINSKLQSLLEQKKSTEMSLSHLKDCKEFVEQNLKRGGPQQVLTSKKHMIERMSYVSQQINIEELNPTQKADVQLIKDSKAVDTSYWGCAYIYYFTAM